ncbi:LIM and SH3 domain protein Lasp [Portunus trituberculatus]|uniref:LIM and SH3 domain protein Lasp n=1 Tax=Portunus trituberculatus TaxID=210409 RepID=A0A5B7E7Q7_PORTR|nr:LIM and SH3 domain protein Lasp [Portunus trituberculatus]
MVQYHADFEKNKAKFTQVADDPETQRLKKNTQIIRRAIPVTPANPATGGPSTSAADGSTAGPSSISFLQTIETCQPCYSWPFHICF